MGEPNIIQPLPVLMNRKKAATWLGIDVKTFDRHVAPNIAVVPIGTRTMYEVEELQR